LRNYIFLFVIGIVFSNSIAQDKLYPNTFPLSDVILLDSPFKHARDLNINVLLEYNVDRLLAPFRKEAGLTPKDSSYKNWLGLDGHIGGHYLSAMAMNYAATGNSECKKRMEYIISELKVCQEANAINNPDWGVGYVGGVVSSSAIWPELKIGDFSEYWKSWVPWYNLHKMYAGLRDAWLYAGSEEAKNIFLKFCDWGLNITSALSDEQMESMLNMEHGGMNEIFADAYQITGDEKYLYAAKRFSHKALLDPMATDIDNLDNKHANTQVPKAIGFQRIAELTNDEKYIKAGSFFWETVINNRTLAFGGNSRKEHFPSVSSCSDYINDVEGAESCNTNNMLKLTEDLFRINPLVKYIDFYERALYNHILSTQHPEHGGYVYFTPARPRHYRVYSSPNEAMWCCVGTGMENHGKYNQLIYTHQNDSLFLNLFIPSELNWKEKGIKIKQETNFPYEGRTKLIITEGSAQFKLMIRYPSWVGSGELKVIINNDTLSNTAEPSSYVKIGRLWKTDDVVEIILPMHHSVEQLPNVPEYVAFLYGPIVLAAKTGTQNLAGLIADDGRWAHIPGGERLPLDKAPIIVEHNLSTITDKLIPVEGKPLTFSISEINMINSHDIVLEPFFKIYDARYMMYWMALSDNEYKAYLDSFAREEKKKLVLQNRTVDFVATGEQQPEADHDMQSSNSNSGNYLDEFWRDARDSGFFSYGLETNSENDLSLMVRYWGYEWGSRKFDIYIDDKKLISEDNTGKWYQSKFQDVVYDIPNSLIKDKNNIRLKFQAQPGSTAGAVYYIRLLRQLINTTDKK
jgi:DUF1680 family protein